MSNVFDFLKSYKVLLSISSDMDGYCVDGAIANTESVISFRTINLPGSIQGQTFHIATVVMIKPYVERTIWVCLRAKTRGLGLDLGSLLFSLRIIRDDYIAVLVPNDLVI